LGNEWLLVTVRVLLVPTHPLLLGLSGDGKGELGQLLISNFMLFEARAGGFAMASSFINLVVLGQGFYRA